MAPFDCKIIAHFKIRHCIFECYLYARPVFVDGHVTAVFVDDHVTAVFCVLSEAVCSVKVAVDVVHRSPLILFIVNQQVTNCV